MKLPIEGHKNLFRDSHSKAIINHDTELVKILNYKREQKQRINNMEDSINTLKEDIQEIKSLLRVIVDQKENS